MSNEITNTSNLITLQTLTGIPSTSPSLTAFSTNPITVRLNLTLPSKETRNGVIIGYSIMYSRVDKSLVYDKQTNGITLKYDVTSLDEYTMYKFPTAAITSVGTGVYSEYVYVRTMESIPSASPNVVFIAKSLYS